MKFGLILIVLAMNGALAGADTRPVNAGSQVKRILESALLPPTSDALLYFQSPQSESLIVLTADIREYRGAMDSLQQVVSRLNLASIPGEFSGEHIGHVYRIFFHAELSQPAELIAVNSAVMRALAELQSDSSLTIASAARLFRPDRGIYAVTGPALAEMDRDPVTGISYRWFDHRAAVERYSAIMGAETHCAVNLEKKISLF